MNKRIVVTGAAGYIGGETVLKLLDAGYEVLGIDWELVPDHLLHTGAHWVKSNFASEDALHWVDFYRPDAIVHCAGTSLVGPSIANPAEYYLNNVVRTKTLLDYLVNRNMTKTRVIFSSSAAVYGEPKTTPCTEDSYLEPISPYGESKLMVEQMLGSYARAYGIDYVALRYFNACGADSQGRHGQQPNATHIIARVLESIRDNKEFDLYGTKYPTLDGTCIRDYIHVEDIALAHIQAIDSAVPAGSYNLGNGHGNSNLEVINAANAVTGRTLKYNVKDARTGDPAILTACPDKFQSITNWKPQFTLNEIIQHAWNWYVR